MPDTLIAIDPGASGGIAIIELDGTITAVPMPATERDLYELLIRTTERSFSTVAFVEAVHSSPQMGVVSAFKFGQSVGAIRMACLASDIRVEYVSPQKWQKELGLLSKGRGLGQGDTAKKNRNKAKCQELFPGIKVTHKIADALLIAEFGRRQKL